MIHVIILSIFISNLADAASEGNFSLAFFLRMLSFALSVVTPAANIEWDKEWTFSG